MTLYELTGQFRQLQDVLAEETDPDYVQTVLDTMESIDFEIEAKADGYAKIIRNLTGDVEALKAEIDRMTARKRAIENNISSLKGRLEDAMIQTGKTKFKTQLFSFGIQNNPPKVVIDATNIYQIPDDLLIYHEPTVDSKAAKEFLKDHPDADWGHLEQGQSLRIR